MIKVPVIVKPHYKVYFEPFRGSSVIHCDVYKWTPAIRRALHEDFSLLVYLHDDPIYAFHEIGDKKHKKFLDLFHFEYVGRVLGQNLQFRELYVRK